MRSTSTRCRASPFCKSNSLNSDSGCEFENHMPIPPLRVMILDACILIPNGNFINWTAASPVAPRHLSTSSTSQQDLRQPTPIRTILHRAAGWITASMASNWVMFCQLIQGKCGQNRTFKKLKMIWCGMMRSKSMVTGDSSVCLFLLFK